MANPRPHLFHQAICSTHEENFGTVCIVSKDGNKYSALDAEAEFAREGWTGQTEHDAMCPDCSRRVYAIGEMEKVIGDIVKKDFGWEDRK